MSGIPMFTIGDVALQNQRASQTLPEFQTTQLHQTAVRPQDLNNNLQMLEQLSCVNKSVCTNTQILSEGFVAVEEAVRGVTRKQRRSIVNDYMTIQPGGLVMVVTCYDDGTQACEPLMLNAIGSWKIYRMQVSEIFGEEERFLLHFPSMDSWIVGKMSRNTGAGLYDYFIRNGIKFNPEIPRTRIQRILYEGLVPEIEKCTCNLRFPEFAGWYEGKYCDSKSYEKLQKGDFPNLPIFRKQLTKEQEKAGNFEEYFAAIRSIRDIKARLCIMMFPFAGMLASIFCQENFRLPVYLNFVWLTDMNPQILVAYMKIFNRTELSPISLDCSIKQMATTLQQINDEVIFINAREREGATAYRRQKIRTSAQDVIELSIGKCGTYQGYECPGKWALAVFSNEYLCDGHALNLFVERDFFSDLQNTLLTKNQDALPEILAVFVDYAQSHMLDIKKIIRKARGDMQGVERFFAIMEEILADFWSEQGIDMRQKMDLPFYTDVSGWIQSDIFVADEWESVFRDLIRSEIQHFELCNRNENHSDKLFTIYYDCQYLWFPTLVLERMLGKNGLKHQKQAFLLKLKEYGVLVTDAIGLTRRMQVGGKRREYYQIKRTFFDVIGKTSIVDLARRCEK